MTSVRHALAFLLGFVLAAVASERQFTLTTYYPRTGFAQSLDERRRRRLEIRV